MSKAATAMDDGTVTQHRALVNDSAATDESAETGNFGQKTKISEIFSSMHNSHQHAFGAYGVVRDPSILISPRLTQDTFGNYGRSAM